MKFSLVAILPAVLWTALTYATVDTRHFTDANAGTAIIMFGLWFVTCAVLAVYWAARIVRFALRSPRAYKPAPWDPPLR